MTNEGGAFLHLLLANKNCLYEEEALRLFNQLPVRANKRRVRNSEELLELLAEHLHAVSKFGFEVKYLLDPLGRTENRNGMFYTLVNREKDVPIQAALALPVRKEALFFKTIIRHLLYEPDEDEEDECPNTVIGRILPISMPRNPDFLRSIVPGEPPLLPRDVERILVRLGREKWIRLTKMGGNPDQLEDSRQRGVWFGARAIAEFPQISRELRRRSTEGPKHKRTSSDPVAREEERPIRNTAGSTVAGVSYGLETPVQAGQRSFDRISSPRRRPRTVRSSYDDIPLEAVEESPFSEAPTGLTVTPNVDSAANPRRGEKRRFQPSSEDISLVGGTTEIPRKKFKSRRLK